MSKCRVELHYFAIALLPMLIFAIHEVLQTHLIAKELNVPPEILQNENTWLEAVGRYRFLAASWFFATLAVLAVAVFVRNLMRPMVRDTRVAAIATALGIFALALLPTIQQHATGSAPGNIPSSRQGGF